MKVGSDAMTAIERLLVEKPQRNAYKRFTILSYQLADVGRCMRYMDIYPDERAAYEKYLKTAVSDLLIQTLVFAKLYNFDFDELVDVGSARLEEYKKKGRYVESE